MARTHPTSSRRGAGAIVALLGLAALLSACSKPVPSNTELVDALQRTGMSATESRCVSDAILDTLSKDEVAAIVERGPSGAPVDPVGKTDGTLTKVRGALTACRDASGATTTTTTIPVPGEGTSSTSSVITDRLDPATTTTTAAAAPGG